MHEYDGRAEEGKMLQEEQRIKHFTI